MVSFTSVVVHNVKHHAHAGLMKCFHHISEFNVLLILDAGTRVLGVRREKVQGHVSPIVALLRVALKNRHQLDNSDAELFEVRDLFHQPRIRPGQRWIYA